MSISRENRTSYADVLPILSAVEGRIAQCPHGECGFRCCDFAQGNYILLYPGELETAQAAGRSTAHLEAIGDGHGGHRAICRAADAATCDGGYKPLDCASYPLFPAAPAGGRLFAVEKGEKCPLPPTALEAHLRWTLGQWSRVIQRVPAVAEWLRTARTVGYTRWDAAGAKR